MAATEVLHTQGIRVINWCHAACVQGDYPQEIISQGAIALFSMAKKKYHHSRLNNEFKADLHGGKSLPHIGMDS